MASPNRSTESTLKRIYESGEWSDLVISTATRDFRVHKNIVCPACPFFEAACTRDFKEAHTGVINLPESAETVDGVLRFIYGFQVGQATIEHAAAKDIDHFRACVDLHVASDKYDLPGLRKITRRSLTTYVCCLNRVSKLVNAGLCVYHQTPGTIDDLIIEHLVFMTAKYLPKIRKNKSQWQRLVSCEDLLSAAMDVVFETGDWALETSAGPDIDKEQQADYSRVYTALFASGAFN